MNWQSKCRQGHCAWLNIYPLRASRNWKLMAELAISLNSNIQFIPLIFKTMSMTFCVCYIYLVKILRLLSIVRSWANTSVLLPFLMHVWKITTNFGIVFLKFLKRSSFCYKISEFLCLNLLSNLSFVFQYYRISCLQVCMEEY